MVDRDYQDIWIQGQKIKSGRRECPGRFAIVRDFCTRYQRPFTVLDVGANSGYFSIRLAEEFPEATVIAIEGHPTYAAQLIDVLRRNANPRVLMLQRQMNWRDLQRLGEVEHFDVVLALSVIHHMPGDYGENLKVVRALGDHLILELPTEKQAPGPQVREAGIPQGARILGHGLSHLGGKPRPIVHLPQRKTTLKNAFLSPKGKGNKLDIRIDSHDRSKSVSFGNKPERRDWHRGINLKTFLDIGGRYPGREHIRRLVADAWCGEPHGDIQPWNVILQGDRAVLIDHDDPNTRTLTDGTQFRELLQTIAAEPQRKETLMANSGWVTCEKCGRVLLPQHGPVCVGCKSKEADSGEVKTLDQMSKAELIAYAEQAGLEIDPNASKAVILEQINSTPTTAEPPA